MTNSTLRRGRLWLVVASTPASRRMHPVSLRPAQWTRYAHGCTPSQPHGRCIASVLFEGPCHWHMCPPGVVRVKHSGLRRAGARGRAGAARDGLHHMDRGPDQGQQDDPCPCGSLQAECQWQYHCSSLLTPKVDLVDVCEQAFLDQRGEDYDDWFDMDALVRHTLSQRHGALHWLQLQMTASCS